MLVSRVDEAEISARRSANRFGPPDEIIREEFFSAIWEYVVVHCNDDMHPGTIIAYSMNEARNMRRRYQYYSYAYKMQSLVPEDSAFNLDRLVSKNAENPEELCVQKESVLEIAEALKYLNPKLREALEVSAAGYCVNKRCEILGVSEMTYYKRLGDARRTLIALSPIVREWQYKIGVIHKYQQFYAMRRKHTLAL